MQNIRTFEKLTNFNPSKLESKTWFDAFVPDNYELRITNYELSVAASRSQRLTK
jgi:hypothetical protein